MVEIVRIGLWLLAAHVAAGAVFAVLFHRRGAAAIDPATHQTGWGFRLVITPGIIALWPLSALRWQRTASGSTFLGEPDAPVAPRRLRAVHGLAGKASAVVTPLGMATAWRCWRAAGAARADLASAGRCCGGHRIRRTRPMIPVEQNSGGGRPARRI